ncbi:transcription initiation factor TFIID subunit 7-like [Mya arenaria]|uniref:transcription initiation factor TFIID subunit 7-like n=1 Tax=Mya arenaria TaxID=6604 RepID=UPI0022E55978|nr:transcription initiation factor TFIID subunit 7-like [Mya arenaria]
MSKKKEGGGEPAYDLEQQFIMRLPPGPAEALRQELRNESPHVRDRLSIELQSDLRKGAIRYGNDYIPAKMVDLPCIIECHKTVDMKTLYKTADISQILIPTTEDDIAGDENEGPGSKKKGDKDKKYLYNHGITPPLKNVRKRRFRKTLKKKYMEQPDIEKEVKRLFRADYEAIDVKWELITEDEKGAGEKGDSAGGSGAGAGLKRTDTATSLNMDIFGDLSSSEEEEEKDINVLDSEDDASRLQSAQPEEIPAEDYLAMDALAISNQALLESQNSADLLGAQLDMKQESMAASQNILDT